MFRLCRVACKPCVLILALFLMLSPSACQSPQQAGNITIRFAYPSQFSADPAVNQSLTDRYKALAAAFHEQNPHITINLVTPTWEQLASLTAKDFDVLLNNSSYYSDYVNRGVLRSLEPWMSVDAKAWSGDYLPTVLQPFERNGELWAIPWALDPLILYYNQDLFTHYEVDAPQQGWTWSDFLEKAHAVTDTENGVYGSVILSEYSLVEAIIYQHGGQIFDDYSQPAQATFDNPRNIEALSWLSSLIYEYRVIPTQAELIRKFGSGIINFSRGINQGKIGMWAAQYMERGGTSWGSAAAVEVPWGAAPLPQDAQAATYVIAYQLGISSQAADADACWQWLAYLSQQLPPDLFLPARTSLREGIHPVDASEQEALAAGSAALEGVLLINTDVSGNVMSALDVYRQAVDAILQKNESAETQLQLAQQKAIQ